MIGERVEVPTGVDDTNDQLTRSSQDSHSTSVTAAHADSTGGSAESALVMSGKRVSDSNWYSGLSITEFDGATAQEIGCQN